MKATEVVVSGAVTPDGSLRLDEKVDLPAGRVRVTVRPVGQARAAISLLDFVMAIRAERDAAGLGGRTLEEAVADIRALRDEWDEHDRKLEEFRERIRARRTGGGEGVPGT
jgi:hypothetical protein